MVCSNFLKHHSLGNATPTSVNGMHDPSNHLPMSGRDPLCLIPRLQDVSSVPMKAADWTASAKGRSYSCCYPLRPLMPTRTMEPWSHVGSCQCQSKICQNLDLQMKLQTLTFPLVKTGSAEGQLVASAHLKKTCAVLVSATHLQTDHERSPTNHNKRGIERGRNRRCR